MIVKRKVAFFRFMKRPSSFYRYHGYMLACVFQASVGILKTTGAIRSITCIGKPCVVICLHFLTVLTCFQACRIVTRGEIPWRSSCFCYPQLVPSWMWITCKGPMPFVNVCRIPMIARTRANLSNIAKGPRKLPNHLTTHFAESWIMSVLSDFSIKHFVNCLRQS